MGLPPEEAGPEQAGTAAGSETGQAPGPSTPLPETGDARVDEALSRLDGLAGLPVAEHPAVFEYVHDRLAEALGDLDMGGHAGPDGQPGTAAGPGR